MIRVVTERLRNGTVLARPEGALGTCGWSPKAWTMAYVSRGRDPVDAFLASNRNWNREEIDL